MIRLNPLPVHFDHYPFEQIEQPWVDRYYEFESRGKRGLLRKGLGLQPIVELPPFVHCMFGDVCPEKLLDTKVASGNNDAEKLMSTIALICVEYLRERPHHKILLKGEDRIRVRLYRSFIKRNLAPLSRILELRGAVGTQEDPRISRIEAGVNYDFFVLGAHPGRRGQR